MCLTSVVPYLHFQFCISVPCCLCSFKQTIQELTDCYKSHSSDLAKSAFEYTQKEIRHIRYACLLLHVLLVCRLIHRRAILHLATAPPCQNLRVRSCACVSIKPCYQQVRFDFPSWSKSHLFIIFKITNKSFAQCFGFFCFYVDHALLYT